MDLIKGLAGRRDRQDPSEGHLVAFTTDIGRTHEINQDAGGVWTWTRDGAPISLLVVADGVSAGSKSEEASRLAVRIIEERVEAQVTSGTLDLDTLLLTLTEAARDANQAIAQRPHSSLARADATTLVAAVCVGGDCGGVWCGDSRAYKIQGERAEALTRDHSWSEEVTASGTMTREQAQQDPRARMITRWLGPPNQEDPGLETFRLTLEPGESLALCSDGLFTYFSDPTGREDELARVIAEHPDNPRGAANQLVATALRRGGRDNISIAILSRRG